MKEKIYIFINRNIKLLLLIVVTIAVIYPLSLVFMKNPPLPPGSDHFDFSQMAIGLLNGRGLQSNVTIADTIKLPNVRHPLYPVFIAVIYYFTDNSIIAVKIIQILIHGLTCIIIFLITNRVFKNGVIGLGAAIAWVIYPASTSVSMVLMSETLLTFLLAASVWFILRYNENPNLKNIFFSGLFLGLTTLTKSVVLAFMPFLLLWLILASRDKLAVKLKNFMMITLFAILTISPWLIRNHIVLDRFFPLSTGSGLSFYKYNNEKTLEVAYTPLRLAFPFTEEQIKKMSVSSEKEIDKYLHGLGWQFIKSHPRDFLEIRLTELCFFWHLWPASPKRYTSYYSQLKQRALTPRNVYLNRFLDSFKSSYLLYFCKILYHMPYNILFLGMFVSFINSFKKNREQWRKSLLLFFLIAAICAVYVFHHGSNRYRMPIDPYVFILGMHGVASFYNALKRRKK